MFGSMWNRRRFLKVLGTTAVAASVSSKTFGENVSAVSIVVDPADEIAGLKPVQWALEQLVQALKARGVAVAQVAKAQDVSDGRMWIMAADARSSAAKRMLSDAKASVADAPEALGLIALSSGGKHGLLACGHDPRGLVYALTELVDLVQNVADPIAALGAVETTVEQPANEVRSMTRLFCSNAEDLPWYNDRAMWPVYFDTLATQRFNRFNLAFGIGYDFISKVTDAYFLFTYPFLLKVPGYNVRVPELPDEERDRNLEMLKYIGEQCVMRGLEFRVGLWMHGYKWINSQIGRAHV